MLSPSTTGKPHCKAVIMGPKRVAAADLANDDGVDLPPQVIFQSANGGHDLCPFLQFFVAHCRRAHAAHSTDDSVIGHVVRSDDRDCPTLLS